MTGVFASHGAEGSETASFNAPKTPAVMYSRRAPTPQVPTQEWVAMTFDERIAFTIQKYGFNLRKGQHVVFDDTLLGSTTFGATAKANPTNPHFPALRSGPTAAPGASLQKQIPSSEKGWRGTPFYWPVIRAHQNAPIAIYTADILN